MIYDNRFIRSRLLCNDKKDDLAVYIIRERGKICWKANIIKSMRTVDIGNNAR